ncbi:MAG: universal stress protein [Actinocrinis sp.]
MQTFTHPRVVVGVDRSLSGLAALRTAVAEARRRGLPLHAVRSMTLGIPHLDEQTIAAAFQEALGAVPTDITVEQNVSVLGIRDALCTSAADPDDLIVVGVSCRGWWHTLWNGSIAHALAGRARCAVLAVPAPEMSRTVRPHRGGRGQWDPLRDLEAQRPEFHGRPYSGI